VAHAGQHLAGRGGVGGLRRGGDLDHRRHEGGGDAVAGNVGEQHAEAISRGGQEIVEVAGDLGGRDVAHGEIEPWQAGERRGQQGALNRACGLELLPERGQARAPGEELARRDRAQAADEDEQPQALGELRPDEDAVGAEVVAEDEESEDAEGGAQAAELPGRRLAGTQESQEHHGDVEEGERREEQALRPGIAPPGQKGKPGEGAGEVGGDQAAQGRVPARRSEPGQEVDEGDEDAIGNRRDAQAPGAGGDPEERSGGVEGEQQADAVESPGHAEEQERAVAGSAGHRQRDGGGSHGERDRRHEERQEVAAQLGEELGRDLGGGRHGVAY